MEYTKLGNTDITVSKICVGCMSFGKAGTMHDWTLDETATESVVRHALDLGIHYAGNTAPNPAVDIDGAMGTSGNLRHLEIEPGPLHDPVAQEQDLGQDEHDQKHGDQRPPAQAHSDAHYGGLRGDPANQKARGGQDAPRGEHRGEGEVQRLDDGLAFRHGDF